MFIDGLFEGLSSSAAGLGMAGSGGSTGLLDSPQFREMLSNVLPGSTGNTEAANKSVAEAKSFSEEDKVLLEGILQSHQHFNNTSAVVSPEIQAKIDKLSTPELKKEVTNALSGVEAVSNEDLQKLATDVSAKFSAGQNQMGGDRTMTTQRDQNTSTDFKSTTGPQVTVTTEARIKEEEKGKFKP